MTTITIERAVIHRALSALEYHTQQTRPIHNTELVIEELKSALSAPATAPVHEEFTCSAGCTTECLARLHGCASECPSLPQQPATAPEQQKQLDLSVFRMSWDYELSAMRKDQSGPYVCFSDLAYMLPATAPEHQAVIVNPIPVEYQYHYPDGAWRCSNGLEINGSKPTASRALYAERDKQ